VRVRRLAAALVGLSLLVAGCGATSHVESVALHAGTPTTVKHPTVSQFDEQAAQTFLIDGPAPTGWNPHVEGAVVDGSVGVLDEILGPVLPSVFQVKPNFQVSLNTALVTSARQTKSSPQTIDYQLNPQATWSDGTPITYQDFVYNWKSAVAVDGGSSTSSTSSTPDAVLPDAALGDPADSAGYDQIASVSEVRGDPYRVKVVFSTPDADWRSLFSLMLPAHVVPAGSFAGVTTDPTSDLSGGPFEVQSAVPGVSVTLVRNPRYWGPQAHLAQVTFRFAPDPAEVLPSFQQAVVDATEVVPTAGLDAGLAKVKGLETTEYAGPEWEQLDLNQSDTSLSDVALRQAILLAVNRTQLIAATIGKADPAVRPLDSMLFVPGQPGYADDAGVYATADVAGAEAVLDAAGYTYRGSTLLSGGKPVVLEITSTAGDSLLQAEERFVVKALHQIGITVHEHDVTDLPETIAAGQYQLAISTENASPYLSIDADRYESGTPGAPLPSGAPSSERKVDAAIVNAATIVGPKARVAAYRALDRRLWSDAVALPLFQLPELLAYDKTYVNMGPNPAPGGPTWDMALWGVPSAS
jgi:peptide/nickel transport system substrate-binding protein